MNKIISFLTLIISLFYFSCGNTEQPENQQENQTSENPKQKIIKAEVKEHMDASSYTYMLVNENGNEYWIAAPQTKVETGQIVYFTQGMEMKNFRSETLDKTFDSIFFVQSVSAFQPEEQIPAPHHNVLSNSKEDINIDPAEGGYTIEQLYNKRKSLAGQTVKVRGKVTKFNPGILNTNWIHLQDGTGTEDNFDLVVTSNDQVKVGQIVIVTGKVSIDKNLGAGYAYKVLIENASAEIEN